MRKLLFFILGDQFGLGRAHLKVSAR